MHLTPGGTHQTLLLSSVFPTLVASSVAGTTMTCFVCAVQKKTDKGRTMCVCVCVCVCVSLLDACVDLLYDDVCYTYYV